jgi:putative sterol carrier protein
MDLESITAKLSEKATAAPEIGRSVKFDFGADGIIFVDGNDGNAVSNDDNEADCTLQLSLADFIDLVKGDLNPMNAFMGGKLKILGDMSVAMKLQSLLG